MPHLNYLAVLVAAIAIFALGGLWYSPLLFAKPWVRLMGKTEEELRAGPSGPMPLMFLGAFVCGFLIALVLAIVLNQFTDVNVLCGVEVGALCWLGFAAATSFTNAMFAQKSKQLWAIDAGYHLFSFIIAGAILGAWR